MAQGMAKRYAHFFFFLPFLHLENRICNIHLYRLASLHFSIYFIFFSSTDNGTEKIAKRYDYSLNVYTV